MKKNRLDYAHVKKAICLYREISESERAFADDHLSGCNECRSLFQEVEMGRSALRQSFSSVKLEHQSRHLTQRIMQAVEKMPRHHASIAERLFGYFDTQPLRFALGSLSLFLLAFFVAEMGNTGSEPLPRLERAHPLGQTSTLDSENFYRAARKEVLARGWYTSYVTCVQCLTTEKGDCATCLDKINKLNP